MKQSIFVLRNNGKYRIHYPGGNPAYDGQCVILVLLKWLQVDGIPDSKIPKYGAAADYWDKPPSFVRKIKAGPNTYPRSGDVVVFDRSLPGSDGYGHIDFAINNGNSKTQDYVGLDSNWAPLRVTKVRHSLRYGHILGYLRLKGTG